MVKVKIKQHRYFNLLICSVMILLLILSAVPCFSGAHDPMQPQVGFASTDVATTDSVDLTLEATVISALRQVAVINGTTVNVGDTYEGYRITAIDEGHVYLAAQGKKRTLALQPVVKTRIEQTN